MKQSTKRQAPAASRKQALIAGLAITAVACHLVMRYAVGVAGAVFGLALFDLPLVLALAFGGGPLVFGLLVKLWRREFGSDLLAGISIVTSILVIPHQYLAGTLVVLMLSGGEALEAYAVRGASSVLAALAKRMPSAAHRKRDGQIADVPLDAVVVGDPLVVFPHEICPVDGAVVEGHGVMDESYLTGEPYRMSKAPGSAVLSGAVNGETALTIRCEKPAADSRYAKIMQVMRDSEQRRPRLRRLGDQLGAWYTPLAVAIALAAWLWPGLRPGHNGDPSEGPTRFLAVLVVATPCPLLIAIPVAIIGSVSLSARRGIIIKDPAVLEKVARCRTAIFDKTGTLTYGQPHLTELLPAAGWEGRDVLALVAGLERYSKHPLAGAVLAAAEKQPPVVAWSETMPQLPTMTQLPEAAEVSERPGQGLTGSVSGRSVQVTSRKKFLAAHPDEEGKLPAAAEGLECVVLIDGRYAADLRFRDQPRSDGAPFIRHLRRRHGIDRVILASGDRESEVRYLAETVGIREVHAGQTPEQKLELVRAETRRANTVYLGDGVNDAPALTAATVGVAFGRNSDVTAEAAGAVILDASLRKVDEFLHIGRRLRTIALQSAVGGMALSLIGMAVASMGLLPPAAGAVLQEVIDVAAVVNALRAAAPPRSLTDY